MSVQFYRLCPLGHKVICPNSLVRPICGVCGQRVENQSPLRRTDEEPEVSAPVREQDPKPLRDTAPADEAVTPGAAEDSGEGANRQRRPAAPPEQPEQPESPVPTRRRRRRGSEDEAAPVPEEDTPADSRTGALGLDLFGMTIRIPEEGGFLGREGIGAQELEGFLLVSRRHAFVKPDRGGRLMVEDRGSTNGTWVTRENRRQRLELGRTEILEAGDTLWLYNIPLKVVT